MDMEDFHAIVSLLTRDRNVRPISILLIISVIRVIPVFMVGHVSLLAGLLILILVCVLWDILGSDVKQVYIPALDVILLPVLMEEHVSLSQT